MLLVGSSKRCLTRHSGRCFSNIPSPRVGKRIDAVVLARDVIIVIEIKTGAAPTSAVKQVDDYALNLACSHEGSACRLIIPLVVANARVSRRSERTAFDHLIKPCMFATFSEIGPALQQIVSSYTKQDTQLDAHAWDEAQFKPIPPIIDAAVALYSNMNVFEMGDSCAAHEDLERTSKTLVNTVSAARQNGRQRLPASGCSKRQTQIPSACMRMGRCT